MEKVASQLNSDKKKKLKIVLLAVLIPLALSSIIVCIFSMYIGLLQYPDWYLKANFRNNKQYFETIINTDECDGFSSGQEYYIDEINDPEVKAAIKELFVNGIWGSFYKDYGTDEKHSEVTFCIFLPNNSNDYNVRKIIYVKDEDLLNKYANYDGIQNLEGNWYYGHYYDNDPWDKGG